MNKEIHLGVYENDGWWCYDNTYKSLKVAIKAAKKFSKSAKVSSALLMIGNDKHWYIDGARQRQVA